MSSEEPAGTGRLRAKVEELRRAGEIRKAASASSAAGLDRPPPRS
ncbi:MAG TPA: hypothetical protein VKV80_20595 [Streptosporangiaceae bacterium]|nr:hypothetical protein [Streptosporangiaceae bacterium]